MCATRNDANSRETHADSRAGPHVHNGNLMEAMEHVAAIAWENHVVIDGREDDEEVKRFLSETDAFSRARQARG